MKRLLLLAVLVCLNITIALAQVTTDSRVNNASVISAPNGIIVIDIAKPDSNGLSNNTYTDFNIPTEGVVFNNNFSQARSRLAGIYFIVIPLEKVKTFKERNRKNQVFKLCSYNKILSIVFLEIIYFFSLIHSSPLFTRDKANNKQDK